LLAKPATNPYINERRIAHGIISRESVPKVLLEGMPKEEPQLVGAPAPSPLPVSVDWRNRWGIRWITTIRDQAPCPACWCFSAVALVEAMVRIEHCVWPCISEGDVHKGMGARAGDYGFTENALNWMKNNGAADPDCFPWPGLIHHNYNDFDSVQYTPTADRNGRTVRIPSYTTINGISDQKKWLDTVGPITAAFVVYSDFGSYHSGVYEVSKDNNGNINVPEIGGHCVLIVGYDDSPGQRCWIAKNSWGPNWGDNGYFRIRYGECRIDENPKFGLTKTDPDPWTKRRLNNGGMLESGYGVYHRNFELLTTAPGSKIRPWWRDNNISGFPWKSSPMFGNDASACPTLISTTFDRNLESVHVTNGRRLHHWWRSGGVWHDGGIFGPTDAVGIPGFIQSNYGAPGNFEVVVRTADSKLSHWFRKGGVWHNAGSFGSNIAFSGASLIQSKYGPKGNFELVCVLSNGTMQHWWRDNDLGNLWRPGVTFGSGVSSPPCMIEGEYGRANEKSIGNFELCVAVAGKVEHWWRNNSGNRNWQKSATFGHDIKSVIALVEGSFGFFNLEVVVLRTDNKLQHYWREFGNWKEGVIIGSV